jgi:site-specific recombinase XerD
LRKAAATRCAENGATIHQLMSLFGWDSERTAMIYTKKANRKKLSAGAGQLLLR